MKWNLVFLLLLTLVFSGLNLAQAEPSAYEKLSDSDKKIVDTVLDEFKRHHMIYLPEMSDEPHALHACAGITEGPAAHGGKGPLYEHVDDTDYKEEQLAVRAFKATPDANGKFAPPTFTGPDRTGALTTYTYKEIYIVSIADKKITVTMTKAESDKPGRLKESPDKKFIEGLASRLQGKVVGDGVILLP